MHLDVWNMVSLRSNGPIRVASVGAGVSCLGPLRSGVGADLSPEPEQPPTADAQPEPMQVDPVATVGNTDEGERADQQASPPQEQASDSGKALNTGTTEGDVSMSSESKRSSSPS